MECCCSGQAQRGLSSCWPFRPIWSLSSCSPPSSSRTRWVLASVGSSAVYPSLPLLLFFCFCGYNFFCFCFVAPVSLLLFLLLLLLLFTLWYFCFVLFLLLFLLSLLCQFATLIIHFTTARVTFSAAIPSTDAPTVSVVTVPLSFQILLNEVDIRLESFHGNLNVDLSELDSSNQTQSVIRVQAMVILTCNDE